MKQGNTRFSSVRACDVWPSDLLEKQAVAWLVDSLIEDIRAALGDDHYLKGNMASVVVGVLGFAAVWV